MLVEQAGQSLQAIAPPPLYLKVIPSACAIIFLLGAVGIVIAGALTHHTLLFALGFAPLVPATICASVAAYRLCKKPPATTSEERDVHPPVDWTRALGNLRKFLEIRQLFKGEWEEYEKHFKGQEHLGEMVIALRSLVESMESRDPQTHFTFTDLRELQAAIQKWRWVVQDLLAWKDKPERLIAYFVSILSDQEDEMRGALAMHSKEERDVDFRVPV